MDFTLVKDINGLAVDSDTFEDVLRFFALDAQYFFVALLAVLFLARGKWRSENARHGVVAAGLAAVIALGVAHVLTMAWDRPRPFVSHPDAIHLFISHPADSSFPSDHATAAFAIAVSILLRSRRAGLFALAMAIVLAVARVAVGVHYPSDVLVGALVGTGAALLLWLPPIRDPLHRFADWLSELYESIAAAVLDRFRAPAPGG
jgi:undecaprenyl-diphosphatase